MTILNQTITFPYASSMSEISGSFASIITRTINILMYTFVFSAATLGYLLLPEYLKAKQLNCNYKVIAAKTTPITGVNKAFYTFTDGSQSWDKSDYNLRDVVCVKNP
jgi:hypothetical protein